MRIKLPCDTPTPIVKRIHECLWAEKLLTPGFPWATSIRLSNPSGIVTIRGKGSDSVAAQRLFRIAIDLISQQS